MQCLAEVSRDKTWKKILDSLAMPGDNASCIGRWRGGGILGSFNVLHRVRDHDFHRKGPLHFIPISYDFRKCTLQGVYIYWICIWYDRYDIHIYNICLFFVQSDTMGNQGRSANMILVTIFGSVHRRASQNSWLQRLEGCERFCPIGSLHKEVTKPYGCNWPSRFRWEDLL